jgi:hypothetical protein
MEEPEKFSGQGSQPPSGSDQSPNSYRFSLQTARDRGFPAPHRTVKRRLVFCTLGTAGDADVMRSRQSSVLPMRLVAML